MENFFLIYFLDEGFDSESFNTHPQTNYTSAIITKFNKKYISNFKNGELHE